MKNKLFYNIILLVVLFCLPHYSIAQKIMASGSEGMSGGEDITEKTIDRCKTYYSYFYIDDEGKGTVSNISWNFGDSNTSTEKNPFHTFQTDQEQTFNLVVSFTQGGTSKSLEAVIKISKSPEVSFTPSITAGCDGEQVSFTVESSIELSSVQFILNGQVLDEGEISRALPAREQPYIAIIKGSTANGCDIEPIQEYITISKLIIPSINPMEVISCATSVNQTFKASAIFAEDSLAVNSGMSYEWDFGDGNTGTGAQVTHFFEIANGDQYTVTVKATYGGCTQTATVPVALDVGNDMFSYELPQTYCAFYPVTFIPSLPENLQNQNITWDFGDGSRTVSSYHDEVVHNFTNTRSYTVSYTVTALIGKNCTYSQVIEVPPMRLSDIKIKANRTIFCTDNFSVDLSIQNLHDVNNYFWRVKGTESRRFENEPTPTFSLSGYGEHTIELVANDAGECVINEIDLYSYPISANIIDVFDACSPHTLDIGYELEQNLFPLNDNSVSRKWEAVGRTTGNTISGKNKRFSLVNLEADIYDITVSIQFEAGCTVTASAELKVGEPVKVDFEVLDGPDFCNGALVNFNNTTDLGSIDEEEVTYLWDYFGNGAWTSSFGKDGSQTYDHLEPGEYNVGLKAVQDGCEGNPVYKKIMILEPQAKFELGVSELCNPDKIVIKNVSEGAGVNSDYVWEIIVGLDTANIVTKDIDEDIVNHPSFQALDIDYGDNIEVTLTIENQDAIPSVTPPDYCIHSLTSSISIATKPEPIDIHWDFTSYDDIESYQSPAEICQGTRLFFDPKVDEPGYYYWKFKNITTNSNSYTSYSRTPYIDFNIAGEWEIQLIASYYNGCTETVTQGKIMVYAMDFTVTSSSYSSCLGEEVTYYIQSGARIEAPNPVWAWYVNDEMIQSGTGKDIPSLKYTYDELNIPQSESNRVYVTVSSDLTNCEINSNTYYSTVTKPIIDFSKDVSEYIDFNFQCDYIETYIDPNISDTTVYFPYYAKYRWQMRDPSGKTSSISESSRWDNVFRFDSFTAGTYTMQLEITDNNGCSSVDSITFDVPELPIGEARFTASDTVLDCPAKVDFIDNADGTAGNSLLRKYYNGSDVPISQWNWYVVQDGLTINTIELYVGELEYYFGPGDYEVYLETIDEQDCSSVSEPIAISVKGVSGSFYINKKAGYAPLTTEMIALPAFVSSEVKSIGYIWASGDGYEGMDSLQTFTYNNDSNWVYSPKLIFESTLDLGDGVEAKCNYDAITDESITVFKKPELEIDDIVVCISDQEYTVNGYDEDFEVADVEIPEKYSYKGTTKYQWSVNGQNIPASKGGTNETATFTYGTSGDYFEINPDSVEGRNYTLEIWVDAVYKDFVKSENDHTDTKVGYSTRTFNVKFVPTPTAVISDLAPVCVLDSAVFDGSKSNFTPFTAGDIKEYTWEFLLDGQYIDSYSTEDSISYYKFDKAGVYTVNLTVSADNICASSTTTANITIYPLPEVSFEAPDVCIGDATVFTNTSTLSDQNISDNPTIVQSFEWYFDWENDSTTISSTELAPTFTYAKAGTYKVKLVIESLKGCVKEVVQEVYVSDYPVLDQSEDFYLCEDASTTLSVSGGTVFEWSTGETTSSITVTPDEDVNVYTVKAWNDTGCLTEDSVTIHRINLPKPEKTVYYACEGDSILLDGTIHGFEGTLGEYQWSNGTTGPKVTLSEPGFYTLTNLVTHDISGIECLITHEYEFIHRPLPPEFTVQDTLFCFEDLGEIVIQAAEGEGYVYYWEDTNETTSAVSRYDGGEYTVRIVDTSTEDNCETTTTMNVTRGCPPIFFNPTAFTPNGDGVNDEFLIRSKYAVNMKMTVYNNWGEIIFHNTYKNSSEAQEKGTGWDGTYQNKLVPSSVYTVIIEYDSEFFGTRHRDATHVTVVR
ncbi:PKD domain-containing protein [Flammeovirga aprica]|uniref:PKD domain-containing protein n=1 Tax=Flammeovirga aprica JL-4 TaxID=694437 RepID=A0A7X9RXW2_9BACT|nr:PKD domain-containing protein [Flammeovirga aprica]NME70756.1 PKD domain-containing protein [Flammeovirga aprica JL-4]